MMVWKMFLLFQGCILRFHVNLARCIPSPARPAEKNHRSLGVAQFHSLATAHRTISGATLWLKKKQGKKNGWMLFCLLPRILTWNLKMMVSKRNFLFWGPLFRFHVKFRGCKLVEFCCGFDPMGKSSLFKNRFGEYVCDSFQPPEGKSKVICGILSQKTDMDPVELG